MIFLDAFFRFTGIGLLLLLAVLSLRDARRWKSAPYLALATLSVAALFAGYAPAALQPTGPLLVIVRFGDIPNLVFVWLFALSLFDRNFRLRPFHILIGGLYCAPIFGLRLYDFGLIPAPPRWILIYGSLTSIALMLHLCYVTLGGFGDDLLKARRASRVYFVIVVTIVATAAAIIDPMPATLGPFDKRTVKIISIWPAIVWGCLWLLTFNQRAAQFGHIAGSGRALDRRDEQLKGRLLALMTDDHIYREPKLTIADLATRLGVSQHKLRALINQGLGYANFSAFINNYRIEAVKTALHHPETADLPVLTLAMDCGFTSLTTFNKAFKTREGMTPTAFRKGLKT